MVAFGLSAIIFAGVENMSSDQVKSALMIMLWAQNIWITVIAVPYYLMIREKPEFPPSLVSLAQPKEANFCENIKVALKLPNYVMLIIVFMLLQGGFLAFGINISVLLTPTFSQVEVSMIGANVILVGVITSMLVGVLLNKYQKYLLMTRLSAWGTFVLLSLCIYTFYTQDRVLLAVNLVVTAIALIPIIPVGIDFSAELAFPNEETVVTGFLLMSAQAFGFFLSLLTLDVAAVYPIKGFMLLAGCAGVAALITLFIKEDLKRITFSRS